MLASTKGYPNRAQVINPEKLVAQYDKAHLIRLMEEEKYFTGGRKACLFDLEGARPSALSATTSAFASGSARTR